MSRTATAVLIFAAQLTAAGIEDLPPNQWTAIGKDAAGARPGSALRYAAGAHAFFLWGYMNDDPELLQELPVMKIPEYDMVSFDPAEGRWRSHLPSRMERTWSRELPLAYIPRTYSGITTGSEQTILRGDEATGQGTPRPDLNIVFDQVAYRPANNSLYYFTGGLTAVYDIARRTWSSPHPRHSPPPVLGGSLVYDPLHDELILFGGGHVAEASADGGPRGFTGTWVFSIRDNDWRMLPRGTEPPPRMNSRMVCDEKNGVLVLFGGDSQKAYLADTWLFDLKTRAWRVSPSPDGPPPRAGHFTVYDPPSGLVLIGGGYNRKDLTDMWGYDAARGQWRRLAGEVPTGFYLTADLAGEQRLILLATSSRQPGDRRGCNVLFPVRTTYAYRIADTGMVAGAPPAPSQPMPKRDPAEMRGVEPDPVRRAAQAGRLEGLAANRWLLLTDPGRPAYSRTWGSATFDSDRDRILYWGGQHCGYEGNDVDAYDLAENTWLGEAQPEYPERLFNHGTRLAGATFSGAPWTEHGRKIYAYDPAGKRMIIVPKFRLTTGYQPDWLKTYPADYSVAPDALVRPPSSYRVGIAWSYDAAGKWKVVGPAPVPMDTLLTTPLGVIGVTVNWVAALNDPGYFRPWSPSQPPTDNAVYLLRGARWERLDRRGPSPQNLYEQTALVYDSRRNRVLLHGGGRQRNELWAFDLKTGAWHNLEPKVADGAAQPPATREAVYLPDQDVVLTYGDRGAMWEYSPAENTWRRLNLPASGGEDVRRTAGENRAMVYDPRRGLVLLVLGGDGDGGKASVFALRYRR